MQHNPQLWGNIPNPSNGNVTIGPNGQLFTKMIPRMGVYSSPHSPQRSNNLHPLPHHQMFPRQPTISRPGINRNLGVNPLTPTQELMMSSFTNPNKGAVATGTPIGVPLTNSSPLSSPEREKSTGIGSRILNSFIPWAGTCGSQSQTTQINNNQPQSNIKSPSSTGINSIFCCGGDHNNGIMTPEFPGSQESNFSFSNKVKLNKNIVPNNSNNELEKENKELRESLYQLGEAVHDYVSKKNDGNNESHLIAALSKQLSTVHQRIGDLKHTAFPTNKKINIETKNEFVNAIIQNINNIFGRIEVLLSILNNDQSAIVFLNEMQKSLFDIGNYLEKMDELYKSKCSELESSKHVINMIEEDNKHLSERLKESNEQIKMLRERIIILTTNIEDNNSIQAQTSSPMYRKLESEKMELEQKIGLIEQQLQEAKKSLELSESKYNNLVYQESIKARWPNQEALKGRSHEDLIDLLKKIDPDSKSLQSIAENIVKKDQNLFVPQPNLKDRVLNVNVKEKDVDYLINDSKLGELHKDTIRMQLEQFQKLHLINENVNRNTGRVQP